jgi:hypothetical protein
MNSLFWAQGKYGGLFYEMNKLFARVKSKKPVYAAFFDL